MMRLFKTREDALDWVDSYLVGQEREYTLLQGDDGWRVSIDGCLETKWSLESAGYGQKTVDGKRWLAHRYAWTKYHGEIPDGAFVCHRCDNPKCINIDHLFLGTHGDNMRDMALKGRSTGGESNASAKLSELEVEEIREKFERGSSKKALAREYGVWPSTIRHIVNGRTWKTLGA